MATIAASAKQGCTRTLRTGAGFKQLLLADNYPIGRWANDSDVDADQRRLFSIWATKSPYLDDYEVVEGSEDRELTWNGRPASALAAAYEIDGLAVSLRTGAAWEEPSIILNAVQLDHDVQDIVESLVTVRHACSVEHVRHHSDWIRSRSGFDVRNGAELWDRRTELFEKLEFCDGVQKNLEELAGADWQFRTSLAALNTLNDYCTEWATGPFDESQLGNASVESTPTLQKYGDLRTFQCPDGEPRTFSWHLKRGKIRVHFIPKEDSRRILVGYVGKHLPTVKHPN